MKENIPSADLKEKPKILVVDDKPDNLLALEKILAEVPADIVKALSGNQALALSLEQEFALALIDVQMPDMDGYETVELLRQEEKTQDLPVIFVSAVYSGDYYRVRGVESGAISFLEKPIVPELLLGKVRLLLEMYRYKRELQEINLALENKVAERTRSLRESNARLEQEIAHRRQVQKELERTLESLEVAQQIAKLGFYERNVRTDEGFWSDGLYRLLGVEPRSIPCTHETFMARVHPDDRDLVRNTLESEEEQGRPLEFECRIQGADGEERYLRAWGAIENDEQGRPYLHRGTLQDITESRQAEKEKLALQSQIQHAQKLESLGVLAGGIAHDFNNLLMAILGNADLALLKMSPVSPGRDNVEEVINASKTAAELCKQMLAYSGKGKFVVEKVDLAELAKEMTHMLSVSISKKAVLKFNFADGVPPIEADPSQIRQIIMNLVTNASEAIGDRSGVIAVSTGMMYCDEDYLLRLALDTELKPGYYSYLEISDTGCGMDRETLEKLFDPFFSTKFTGRGLGLSAVLGIVRGHCGAIKPYSEPGRGTTFKVLFPALMDEVLADNDLKASTADEEWQPEGAVLVIDDEEAVRAISKGMLEYFGFDVLTAPDGREGLDVFREHADKILCVLLDLTMPHMDGEECFRELRRIRSDIRVLLSSGYTEYDVESRFAGKGLAGFVQKPYTKAELEAAMKAILAS